MMLENGRPIHEVSRTLGHSSIAITGDIYGHSSTESQREGVESIAESVFAQVPDTAR